jgi:hypothetical protein
MKREMALIIGYALCSALGATVLAAVFVAVGADKRRPQRELPSKDVCRCAEIVYASSLTGGIWKETGDFYYAILSNVVPNRTSTHCIYRVPADDKPASAGKE